MVEKYVSVRSKLDSKVFTPYGISATFIKKITPVYNSRGELDSVTTSTGTINIVPYNLVANRQSYEKFGNLNEGDLDAAVRYDTDINIDDEVVLNNVNYKVKQLNEEYLKEIVVKILRLTKG